MSSNVIATCSMRARITRWRCNCWRGKDGAAPPPILLLSATPYRFYAERWESGGSAAPHVEFFEIVEFLGGAAVRAAGRSPISPLSAICYI